MTRGSRARSEHCMTDKSKPPSFDDIMKAASRPPSPERKEPKKAAPVPPSEPPKRKPSAPTFAEIIGSVELRPEDRAPRPPPPRRPRKEDRKMPVVVRKPSLGKPDEAAQTSARDESAAPADSASTPPEQRPSRPIAESAFAQPGADEGKDFAALLA